MENFSFRQLFHPEQLSLEQSKDCPKISSAEELTILDQATKILGVTCGQNSAYGTRVRRSMRARIKEGFKTTDLIVACRCADKMWQAGERWIKLRDLLWVWTRGFEILLATKGEAGRPTKKAPVFRSGKDREEWEKQIRHSLGEEIE